MPSPTPPSQAHVSSPERRAVGRVVALWRYPVKSLAGESLDLADASWHGLAGDRRWAFVRGDVQGSGFPWMTLRQSATMANYRPSFTDPSQPDSSSVIVATPSGEALDVLDPRLAAEFGENVYALKQQVGIFDTMPVSVLTTNSVSAIGRRVGRDLTALRFRPNIVIEAEDGHSQGAYPEDDWVGRTLEVGEMHLRIDQRDQRCAVVNIEPTDASRDPTVLRSIAQDRQSCLGVYGSTVRPGRLQVGDSVFIHVA